MAESPGDAHVAEEGLRAGIELEGEILKAGQEIRELSKRAYGSTLLDARLVLTGLAAEIAALHAGESGKTEESLSQRLALIAAALQGAGVTETLISEGQYVKAATALRQDLELLARLRELDEGLAKVGKVANIKNAPMGAGPIYGYLSGLAHVAQPDVIDALLARQELAPGAVGVAVVPHFVEDTAVGFYELHVWELVELVREMVRLHLDLYGEEEGLLSIVQRWDVIVTTLLEAGHLKPPPGAKNVRS